MSKVFLRTEEIKHSEIESLIRNHITDKITLPEYVETTGENVNNKKVLGMCFEWDNNYNSALIHITIQDKGNK